jgi:hypothetical protein
MMTMSLIKDTYVSALLMCCSLTIFNACDEDLLLPPPDNLNVPYLLRVPPIEDKYLALKSILDGILDSVKIDNRACEINPLGSDQLDVACTYPQGGRVEFVGYLSEERRDKQVLGETNQNTKQDLRLKYIKLENYKFMAHSGPKRIAAPNTCRFEVSISGEGRVYGSIEHIIKGEERILFGLGGVYQGEFTVSLKDKTYQFDFLSPGFYYRRDITPLSITSDDDNSNLPSISALQISLISSGKFNLDGQGYSYQDVFLEIFTAESFWDAGCVNNP